jgi:hypothetical protein
MSYDSTHDTRKHIGRVQELLNVAIDNLDDRAAAHDASKLVFPEKEMFDQYTPMLRDLTYGSPEYAACLEEMKQTALKHHYEYNSHHPEHYPNGFDGMSLLDILEMLADWRAATERHADGSLTKSLEMNRTRFGLSEQLYGILVNTAKELGWL